MDSLKSNWSRLKANLSATSSQGQRRSEGARNQKQRKNKKQKHAKAARGVQVNVEQTKTVKKKSLKKKAAEAGGREVQWQQPKLAEEREVGGAEAHGKVKKRCPKRRAAAAGKAGKDGMVSAARKAATEVPDRVKNKRPGRRASGKAGRGRRLEKAGQVAAEVPGKVRKKGFSEQSRAGWPGADDEANGKAPGKVRKRDLKRKARRVAAAERAGKPGVAGKAAPGPPELSKAALVQAIRMELGRWAVLDRVVEAYDANVSPVLGGAEGGRSEQKRKRHLEAWLWARLFHPLLPLGEPSPGPVEAGDAALAQKLQNAGLRPAEAKRRVGGLAQLLGVAALPAKGDAAVALEQRGSGLVALSSGGRAVEVRSEYLARLRGMYTGPAPEFHRAAFLLLARYRILQVHDKGGGNQGAVPRVVFQALQDWAGEPVVEAFASPLNTLAAGGNYHSAFRDVDGAFGSRGSFFDAVFTEGVVEVNPPFDQDIIMRVAKSCEGFLTQAAAAKRVLAFLVIVPETDWPGHAALLGSRFLRWRHTLAAGSHFYQVGNQHLNATRGYPASRNTTLLLLAARPLEGSAGLRRRVEGAFRAAPA